MTKVGQNIDFTSITSSVKNGKFDTNQFAALVGGQSYSDIAWFATALETMNGGSNEQKIQTVTNMFTKFLDIFSDLSTDNASNADKKVKDTDKAIDDNNKKAEVTFDSVNEKLEAILNRCDICNANINVALKQIEALGGESGAIAQAQEQLKEKIKIINTQKEILNNETSSKEQRKSAISIILSTVGDITQLAASVDTYKATLEGQTEIVNGAAKEVNGLASEMKSVVESGVNDTQTIMNNVAGLTVVAGGEQTESVQNTAMGGEQIAVGTKAEVTIVGGAEGAKLIASGTDKVNAGRTLMQGAINHFKELGQSQTNLSNGLKDFVDFSQAIGQYSTGILELTGSYNQSASDLIQSVGTWENVKAVNSELETYTKEYESKLGLDNDDEEDDDNNTYLPYNKDDYFEFDTTRFGVEVK